MLVKARLERAFISEATIEAEILIRHVLAIDRAQFFSKLYEKISQTYEIQISRLLERRIAGEPLSYITETREFYGLDFYVNTNVLIPRQETELLVDDILGHFSGDEYSARQLEVADVGTGSGIIAITIAYHLTWATVYATDISLDALHVADNNRQKHGVEDRVHLLQGDLLEAVEGPVDVIVANLPYLSIDDLVGLSSEVNWEPRCALDGGVDGLDVIRRFIREVPSCLRVGGVMLLEIAPTQGEAVLNLCRESFPDCELTILQDLAGLSRVVRVVSSMESSHKYRRPQFVAL